MPDVKYICDKNIVPLLLDKAKNLGCSIEFVNGSKFKGIINTGLGDINFEHNGLELKIACKSNSMLSGVEKLIKEVQNSIV
jgi:hypothetical protein